jgi:cell division protein FtsN
MEENNSVFVFDKKEVILTLVFIVVLAATSFTLGVRMGMKWKWDEAGIEASDVKTIKLRSTREEEANTELNDDEASKPIGDDSYQKLKEEFSKLDAETKVMGLEKPAEIDTNTSEIEKNRPKTSNDLIDSYDLANQAKPSDMDNKLSYDKSQYIGKYTIQVGAYNNVQDAKDFAAGFEVRGYTPVIHEVELSNKGTWYRVSIGLFETKKEAQNYISQEKSLFQSYDYLINRID